MIHLSIPILVRADTPLRECVKQMKDAYSSSVLIIGDDAAGSLIGIFTERDLLNNIDLIQDGNHWDRPVRTVMTSPVITIDAAKIDEAAKVMANHKIRQIPVINYDPDTRESIAGVATLCDIFIDQYADRDRGKGPKAALPKICLVSEDSYFSKLMTDTIASLVAIPIEKLDSLENPEESGDLLIFDIDGFEEDAWPLRLKELNANKNLKLIIIAFTPQRHSSHATTALDKLRRVSKFWVFKKPSEIIALVTKIHKTLS